MNTLSNLPSGVFPLMCVFQLVCIGPVFAQSSNDSTDLLTYTTPLVEIAASDIELPYSISRVERERVIETSSVNIAPLLNSTPGIWMQSGALNTNRISIRGVGNREPFATSKLKAYIDEIPLTTGIGESTVEDIDPLILKRIDIWRNPASALWGAGLGGMLHMITSEVERPGVSASIMGGSFGRLNVGVAPRFTFGDDDQHGLALKYGYLNDDGYRDNNQYDRHSATLLQKLNYKGGNLSISLFSHFIDLRAFIPSSLGITAFNETPEQAGGAWGAVMGNEDYTRSINGASIRLTDGDRWTYHGSLFYQYFNSDEVRPFNILKEKRNTLGTRQRAVYYLNAKDFITGGFEYFNEMYDWQTYETRDGGMQGELLTDQSERRNYFNVFVQGQWEPVPRLLLHGGLNLNLTLLTDSNQSLDYPAILSPSISASYGLVPTRVSLFTSISRGFSQIGIADALDADGIVNSDLKPETGWNYELGLRYESEDKTFNGVMTAYYMPISNLVVRKRITEMYYETINAGKTLHRGIEAEGNYSRGRFFLSGSYTLAFHKFEDFVDDDEDYSGNDLTGSPQFIFHHTIGYRAKSPNQFTVSLDQHYVGETPITDDNTVYGDAFWLFDLQSSIQFPIGQQGRIVQFVASINNLFNVDYTSMYQINAAGFGGSEPRYYYPGKPRSFYLAVNFNL